MTETRLPDNSDILKQLVETVSILSDVMSRFIRTHDDSLYLTNSFREDLRELRDRIERIVKVLHEGNGQQPIITRLALAEQKISQFEKDFEDVYEHFESETEEDKEEHSARISFRGGLLIAVITAIASIAAAVISMS